ncbi:MAG: acetyl-CoA carboxylase biotin carboxyl carrier protein [Williamsia sp.]|nr:acetyl-CoA carboxylase biotin carboxyl carrier protein [Williamsia sp.]
MDFKQLQELIRIVSKSNIGEITIEEKEYKVTIKQKPEPVISMPAPVYTQIAAPAPLPASAPAVLPAAASAPDKQKPAEPAPSNLLTIKSPMIGTFYRSPSPDKPSFVNIGDEVTSGRVVCIIEAMKLFNEIESEVSGKIVKVMVEDASPVEYDQPLFLVEPA